MRGRKESTRPDPPGPREIKAIENTYTGETWYHTYINGRYTGTYLDRQDAERKIYNSIHGYPVEFTAY